MDIRRGFLWAPLSCLKTDTAKGSQLSWIPSQRISPTRDLRLTGEEISRWYHTQTDFCHSLFFRRPTHLSQESLTLSYFAHLLLSASLRKGIWASKYHEVWDIFTLLSRGALMHMDIFILVNLPIVSLFHKLNYWTLRGQRESLPCLTLFLGKLHSEWELTQIHTDLLLLPIRMALMTWHRREIGASRSERILRYSS